MENENKVINNETVEVTGGLLKSSKGKIAVAVSALAALAGVGFVVYNKVKGNKTVSEVETIVNEINE